MAKDDVQRHVALLEEVRVSVYLLQAGLRGLQEIGPANDQYLIPFGLLTSGLERLMKVVVCYNVIHLEGRFPTSNDVRPFGHDLIQLLDWIVGVPWPHEYSSRPAAREDISYLRGGPRLREIVYALQQFADARLGRYHNLEIALGNEPGDSPEQTWARLEMRILHEDPSWSNHAGDPAWLNQAYSKIAEELVGSLERMIRAIVRLFTLGALGDDARKASGLLGEFLFLLDEDLGRKGYGWSPG